jgi:protein SCO1/2
MTDHHGKPVSWSSYRGKWLVVYFGYTGCPDACPTGLSEIAKEMKALGKDAERVQVALVTLDPERDTPQVLAGYVPYFAPSFVGLRPKRAQMEDVIRPFGVQVEKVPGKSGQGYELNHSLDFFVIDPDGRLASRFLTPLPPGAFRKALHLAS